MHVVLLLVSIVFTTGTLAKVEGPVYRTHLDLNHSRLTVEYGGSVFDNTTLGTVQQVRNVSDPPVVKTRTWLLDTTSKPVPAIMIMMGHHIQSGSRPLYLRWLATNVTLTGDLTNTLVKGGNLTSTEPLDLSLPLHTQVPYMDPLIRCQQNNTVWCGQNHIISIYPQVEGFSGTAGSSGGNMSRMQEGYDVAQLRLDDSYFKNIAANNRSGFNVTQFQLDIGLARAEQGRLLSETSPIGVIQMSTFGPDAGLDPQSAASFQNGKSPSWLVMLPAVVVTLHILGSR